LQLIDDIMRSVPQVRVCSLDGKLGSANIRETPETLKPLKL
jgi:hypothetical protein